MYSTSDTVKLRSEIEEGHFRQPPRNSSSAGGSSSSTSQSQSLSSFNLNRYFNSAYFKLGSTTSSTTSSHHIDDDARTSSRRSSTDVSVRNLVVDNTTKIGCTTTDSAHESVDDKLERCAFSQTLGEAEDRVGMVVTFAKEEGPKRPAGWLGKVQNYFQNSDFLNRCISKSLEYSQARQGDGDVSAGHVGRYISLANPDRLSSRMCHVPLLVSGGMVLVYGLTAMFDLRWYLIGFGLLSSYMILYILFTSVLSVIALMKCRSAAGIDWKARWKKYLEENPGEDQNMLHVVILPNYKEDEDMLCTTIANLSKSELAESHMVIVLGMEAREGPEAKSKADRIIKRFSHNFKDIFATYHPPNIPGDVAGKSSNTQWAFRELQKWYGSYVSANPDMDHDMSKVFLTIADADTIVNPNYFTALSVQGLDMSVAERSWCIFQAPVMLTRNWETSPSFLRVAAYGTLMWELSGLMMASWVDAFCFSCYSMTFALANHPIVDGWDADVIAEDHHMYLKCMFASFWEELFSTGKVQGVSKLSLEPIWLPVTSYLAEAGSLLGSAKSRFDQARRHMQGVAELSYAILQYITISSEMREKASFRYHSQVLGVIYKLFHIHVMTSFHGIQSLVVGIVMAVWAFLQATRGDVVEKALEAAATADPTVQSIMIYGVGVPMACLSVMFTVVAYICVSDTMSGRYCPRSLQSTLVVHNDSKGKEIDQIELDQKEKLWLWTVLYMEGWIHGQMHVVLFAAIPHYMAVCSLSVYGHKFDYKCAVKPPSQKAAQIGNPEDDDSLSIAV